MLVREQTYRVAEVFGPVGQGEGPHSGLPVHFIRFGGCSYRCTWCDSMHAVDPELVKQLPILTTSQLTGRLSALEKPHKRVVFSGGDPLLWDLEELCAKLKRRGWKINVETQGVIFRPWARLVELVVVSPKPPSAGNITSLAIAEKFRSRFDTVSDSRGVGYRPRIAYKFVIFDERDYTYAVQMTLGLKLREVWFSIGTLATDDTSDILKRFDQVLGWVKVDTALEEVNVYTQPQMHVLVHGHILGV